MLKSSFELDFSSNNQIYFDLLIEEDFNFKNKDINVDINLNNLINIEIQATSVLELKIATNAIIKSLEVITKTLDL